MKLELQQNRLKPYILATLIISVSLLAFAYLFAAIPHLPADNELEAMVMNLVKGLFGNYENIVALTGILSMFCFSVMSSVILSKFVVSDYTGKRANLLFAYPVDRDRMLLAKVAVASLFTLIAMVVCNLLLFGVFFMSESIAPLVGEILSSGLIYSTVKITLTFAFMSVAIGFISLWFGFNRKSVVATMIPSYILGAVFSNLLGSAMLIGKSLEQSWLQITLTVAALVVGTILMSQLARKVNVMEAE
jgi:ABC-type transport system involved in multi-copper enzyme maturation permease subunit